VTLKMTHRAIVAVVFLSRHGGGTHERRYDYFYLESFVFLRGFEGPLYSEEGTSRMSTMQISFPCKNRRLHNLWSL
jgi:hypothetical protein